MQENAYTKECFISYILEITGIYDNKVYYIVTAYPLASLAVRDKNCLHYLTNVY
ncbi:MAG: hypothetical protein Kow00102_06540 [Spirochaetota bacterium]